MASDPNELLPTLARYGFHSEEGALLEFASLALAALNSSPGGVMAFRPLRGGGGSIEDFTCTFVNPRAAHLLGISATELKGRRFLELMPGHPTEELFHKYVQVAETGERLDLEHSCFAEGGEGTWFHTVAVRAGGEVVATSHDITARKWAERAVAEREARLLSLLEAVGELAFVLDRQHVIVSLLTGKEEATALPPEAFLGRGLETIGLPGEVLERLVAALERAERENRTVDVEYWLDVPRGRRFFSARISPVRCPDDHPSGAVAVIRDQTELREIEDALRARSLEIEAFFDIAPDLLCILDLEGRIVRIGASFSRILSQSPDQLMGTPYVDLVPPKERELTAAALREVARGTPLKGAQGRVRSSDGSTRVLEWNALQSDGHIFGVARDITHRLEQEREQRRADERLRHLTEHVPGAVYQLQLSPDGHLSLPYASSGFETIFGVSPEVVGQDAEAALATLHPDDVEDLRASVAESARSMRVWDEEFRILSRDGSVRWLHGHSTPRPQPDGSVIWYGFVSDVSQRRESEARLRASEERFRGLFELSPLGIALNDLETGRFLQVNEAFARATGHSSHELLGLSYWDLTPGEYSTADQEQLENLLRTGRYGPYEKPYLRRDGSRSVGLFSGILVTGPDQRPLIWSIVQDISERKRQEQARLDLQRRRMDNQRVESLGVMAGGMAHEFNNLLTVMLGNLELMGLDAHDAGSETLISEAVQAGRRAAGVVSRLLALSGRGPAPVATVHLNEVVEGWRRGWKAPPDTHQIHLSLSPEVPEVHGNSTTMRWVLDALVSNSLEAMEGRPGEIRVETGGGPVAEFPSGIHLERMGDLAPGDYAWVEVRDDGPGMDEETRRRLFDPFFSTRFPGRGLGLPGVLGVVRLVNGGVELESSPGEGTRVRIYIPARKGGRGPS